MTVQIVPVSFDYESAALATGLSVATLKRAVAARDLTPRYVTVGGAVLTKPVIEREELERWVRTATTERP
jgi:hypothetical protein